MIDFFSTIKEKELLQKENDQLHEENFDLKQRLKGMEKAYFEILVDRDRLKQKLEDMNRETMPVLRSSTNAS